MAEQMTKAQIEKRVNELNPCLDPLIDQLDELIAANDVAGFELLLTGVEQVMSKAFIAFRQMNPGNDLDQHTIQ